VGPYLDSFGDGVLRDLITCLATRRLCGSNSPLQDGYDDKLYWQPRVLSPHLQPTVAQVEDAFLDGAAVGLQLVHCQSYPQDMALSSLLVHMSGTTAAFTRQAADELMPDLVEAINRHREGNVEQFARLCYLYLSIPVC
jgi:hypothetical protein